MSFRNCPLCGALFAAGARDVCPRCAARENEQFDTVKAYLESHPEAVLEETAGHTGVDRQTVLRFIRSGRLVVGRPQLFGLACERCGKPIATGVVCPECAKELSGRIRDLTAPKATRMYTWKNDVL